MSETSIAPLPEPMRRQRWPFVLSIVIVIAVVLAFIAHHQGIFRSAARMYLVVSSDQPVREGAGQLMQGKDTRVIAQEMQAALTPVIANAQKLTDSLLNPEGPFQQTLKESHELVLRMPAVAEQASEIAAQAQQSVKAIEQGTVATLHKAGNAFDKVEQAVPKVMDRVQEAAATSQAASVQIQAFAAQASERLPAVLDEAKATAVQVNQMVSSARQTWPISMLTGTATTPQSLPIDSIGGLPLPGEAP